MAYCVARTPKPTQRRESTRDNAVALTANEMPWPSPRRLRSTPKRQPAPARRASPSRSPSPAPSLRAGRGRSKCTRLLPAGLVLVIAIAVLAVAARAPAEGEKTTASYAEVRLADRASEIDTTKLMSARADGRNGVMYLDGQKDTSASGWAQGLLNKFTRQVLRNATRDLDASRRRREASDVPPGGCIRISDDYLQVRDPRFEAFVRKGPSGAMAAKAMNTVANGWGATLMHEMVVGCSSSSDAAPPSATNEAKSFAESSVTIWWALGDDKESTVGAATLPGDGSESPMLLNTVKPGDAVLAIGRELSDKSVGPVPTVGTNPAVFWWYGMTLTPAPTYLHDGSHANANSDDSQTVLERPMSVDLDAATAAAEAAESASALQPIVKPWPISNEPRPYTEPEYTNAGLVLVQQFDQNADLTFLLPTAGTLKHRVSELNDHRRVLTELATTRIETVADDVRTITVQALEIATSSASDTKVAVGEKIKQVSEWLSTDPLRRYLVER